MTATSISVTVDCLLLVFHCYSPDGGTVLHNVMSEVCHYVLLIASSTLEVVQNKLYYNVTF